MSRIVLVCVGALENGSVPSLPLRLVLSNERVMFAVIAVNVKCLEQRGVEDERGSRKPKVEEGGDV